MNAAPTISRALPLLAFAIVLTVACGGDGSGSPNNGPTGPTGTEPPTHPSGTPSGKFVLDSAPHGVDVSATGTVYVTRLYGKAVARFPLTAPGSPLPPLSFPTEVAAVVFNRAGTVAYLSGDADVDNFIYVVDVATGAIKSSIPVATSPYHLALSRDESQLFATAAESRVWSAPTGGGTAKFVQLTGLIQSLAVSPTENALFVTNLNGVLRRLDPSSLAVQLSVSGLGLLGDIVVSPDGKQVCVVNDGFVLVLDASTLAMIGNVSIGSGVRGMAMSPDGEQLYVTSFLGELIIVDRVQRAIVKRIPLGGTPAHLAFDRSGKTAVIPNENGWVDIIK
jgi:DNA-binding beta-propeller fold protein YncE